MNALESKLKLKQELIPTGRDNRTGRRITVTSITVHNTANDKPGANADAHSRFVRNKGGYELNGKKNPVSWHFTVDDREAIQQLPINEHAIHAGKAANRSSLAIEVCMHSGIDQAAADLRAARLVARLLAEFDLPISAVRTHKSWTNKSCPGLLLPVWNDFVHKVNVASAELKQHGTTKDLFKVRPAAVPESAVPAAAPEAVSDEDLDGDIEHEALNDAVNAIDD